MLQSSFLKFYARDELKGEYFRACIGAVVVLIASYCMSAVNTLALQVSVNWYVMSILLSLGVTVFVEEILRVSFIKSLMRMTPVKENLSDEKRYVPEAVLSGFKEGYLRTLRTTLVRQVYLLGWGLLAFVPVVVLIGVFAYLSDTPEIGGLMSLIGQYQLSPTSEMALHIGEYIEENCSYVMTLVMVTYVMMFVLLIPSIYKKYEYIMIPFIVAENPEITTREAFKRTRELMHGYRRAYFKVELSFIILMLIPMLVTIYTMSVTLTYIATAAIMPYTTMTFLQFYRERKIMLNPDTEGDNDNED